MFFWRSKTRRAIVAQPAPRRNCFRQNLLLFGPDGPDERPGNMQLRYGCVTKPYYIYIVYSRPARRRPRGRSGTEGSPWSPNPRALNADSKPFLRKERVSALEGRKNLPFLQCYSYITTNQNLLHFVFSSVIMRNEQTREIPRLPGIDTAKASRGMYTV